MTNFPIVEHWDNIATQRRGLADQLESLTPDQWATKSLCHAWTIKDVVAHLVMPHEVSIPRFTLSFVAARFSFNRASETLTARLSKRSTTELIADLRRHADGHFKPPGFGSEAPLTDVLIHGQDIRIPLGLDTPGPIEPWRAVLDFVVTPKARRGFGARTLPAVRIRATDLDWDFGSGDEVSGPAIALALTIMGRRARIEDLSGPGAPEFVGIA